MTAAILRAGAILKIDAKDSRETIAASRRRRRVDQALRFRRAALAFALTGAAGGLVSRRKAGVAARTLAAKRASAARRDVSRRNAKATLRFIARSTNGRAARPTRAAPSRRSIASRGASVTP